MNKKNLLQKTINRLKEHNLYAKKDFGQNFLISQNTLDQIISSANISPSDTILEIGPGTGNLTEEIIAQNPKKLVILEKDTTLEPILKNITTPILCELNFIDALKFETSDLANNYKVIANIPYYITSPLINHFLLNSFVSPNLPKPKSLTLMVQLEVAEKICKEPKLGVLQAQVTAFGTPRIVCKVPASKFHPAPKVDSAVIHIDVSPTPYIKSDPKVFFQVLKASLSSRRKNIKNNLKALSKAWKFNLNELFVQNNLEPTIRAESLNVKQIDQITSWIIMNKN